MAQSCRFDRGYLPYRSLLCVAWPRACASRTFSSRVPSLPACRSGGWVCGGQELADRGIQKTGDGRAGCAELLQNIRLPPRYHCRCTGGEFTAVPLLCTRSSPSDGPKESHRPPPAVVLRRWIRRADIIRHQLDAVLESSFVTGFSYLPSSRSENAHRCPVTALSACLHSVGTTTTGLFCKE